MSGLTPADGIGKYFIRTDASGEGSGLRTGAVGLIYGMNVFYSRSIASGTGSNAVNGAVYRSDACVFAAQQDIRVQSEYSVDSLGTKVVADVIFGTLLTDHANFKKGIRLNQQS